MLTTQLEDEQKKQENDAEREAREVTEQITRINALIENQIRFETKWAN